MRNATKLILALSIPALGGCAADITCDEPQPYQSARETEKIDAPEGLDDLQEAREMSIPRASPQEAPESGSPCLDIPPTLPAQRAD